jgi:hypothetical protein
MARPGLTLILFVILAVVVASEAAYRLRAATAHLSGARSSYATRPVMTTPRAPVTTTLRSGSPACCALVSPSGLGRLITRSPHDSVTGVVP